MTIWLIFYEVVFMPFVTFVAIVFNTRDSDNASLFIHEPTPADTIFFAQSKIISELAEKESCVIVGRCSDYILRERNDCLNVFICSDTEGHARRILERYGNTDKPIQKRIEDKDTRRRIYYSHYTDRPWGITQNYDVCLNSG